MKQEIFKISFGHCFEIVHAFLVADAIILAAARRIEKGNNYRVTNVEMSDGEKYKKVSYRHLIDFSN